MRRAAARDGNEPAIVKALLDVGCRVHRLSGAGLPDLLVARRGVTYLLEVKDPAKVPSKRQLTPEQVKFHADWQGSGGVCVVVQTPEEALAAVGCAVVVSSGARLERVKT